MDILHNIPQDTQTQVAVRSTQWVSLRSNRPPAVAYPIASPHVVQTYAKPQMAHRSKMHIPGIDDLPGAALRRERLGCPPRRTLTVGHNHEGAVLLFFCAFIASSCLKFQLETG